MFNLRYHIASLVAVFLALAVGLLLGGVVVERGTLDRQRDSIVKSLRDDFERLSAENRELSGRAERHERFAEELLPGLLAGRLAGRSVVILVDPSRRDVSRPVRDAVRAAGGEPVTVRLRFEGFGLDETGLASALPGLPEGDAAARAGALADALAAEWLADAPRPVTEKLRLAGVFDGDELPEGPPAAVVAAASWQTEDGEQRADAVAEALLARMAAGGVPVAAVEVTGADTGCVRAAVAEGLPAVDHADTPEGAVSLVWVLSGRAEGYFGVRSGSDAAFPKLAE
ncbi:MAG: copper transporter [Coriobacteriia bacterium]|nr:copper transporter [Coriobacteriia bacterium]